MQYYYTVGNLSDKIGNNIRHLRGLEKLSLQALANDLEISKGQLASYEQGRAIPPAETLLKISNYFHLATDVLLRANLKNVDLKGLMDLPDNRLLFPVIRDDKGNDQIEVISTKASAGYLKGYSDPEYIERLQKFNLPFLPAGKHRMFPIKGDSMPPLRDGSFVVGKKVDSINGVKDGNTYVLLTKSDGIVYKRLHKSAKKKDVITLISDNKAYQPYDVKFEDVYEIWEYYCSLNVGAYKQEELNMDSILAMLREMQVDLKSIRNDK